MEFLPVFSLSLHYTFGFTLSLWNYVLDVWGTEFFKLFESNRTVDTNTIKHPLIVKNSNTQRDNIKMRKRNIYYKENSLQDEGFLMKSNRC